MNIAGRLRRSRPGGSQSGANVDPARCSRNAEDFTALWLEEVQIDDVPRNWLRWAASVTQLDNKVTGGNPRRRAAQCLPPRRGCLRYRRPHLRQGSAARA
ncbi:hypothetical protein NLS1_21370 [Nocardioides sp. LS1]|nr:hypothetical protein NLS1_21370 [Nocardioides sp. LS1]